MTRRLAIIGGGAAGIFAAIRAAERGCQVVVFEKGSRPLTKVGISGGGRCNVTHDCRDARELVTRYPRGGRELLGALSRWGVDDTIDWFADHGVELKTEADGRMFPVTDDSGTVIDALLTAAREAGVDLRTRCGVESARRDGDRFRLELADGNTHPCDSLLIATGGLRAADAVKLVESFGHEIVTPAPSLFTFHVDDPRLVDLAGLAVPDAQVKVIDVATPAQRGPVLVTHWGLSGPGVLKLSAFAAPQLAALEYRFDIEIDWTPALATSALSEVFQKARVEQPKRRVASTALIELPRRLWQRLVTAAGIGEQRIWAELTKVEARALTAQVRQCRFAVTDKSLNKDEFVTCGGVSLAEVDMRRLESKLVPGLHFAGEILNIDGITGGYNLQAAWTTGRIVGERV